LTRLLPVLAIHSRDDQVAPFDPAAARIAELQKADSIVAYEAVATDFSTAPVTRGLAGQKRARRVHPRVWT
jgi:hypothetical protein